MSPKRSVCRLSALDLGVTETGDGQPALVFLHYWGGSSRTWEPAIEILSTSNRCVAVDFRGWGRSSKDAADYALESLAGDVIEVIEKLGLERFIIVGHSMGGKVAQLVASHGPKGLDRLILVAPAPPTGLDVPLRQREQMIDAYQTREGVEATIGLLAALPLTDAYRERIIEDTLCGSPAAKRAWPDAGMTKDISDQASLISVPVHIIVGSADGVEPETSLRAAFGRIIPTAGFSVIPGAGHLLPLEAPGALADAIRAAILP